MLVWDYKFYILIFFIMPLNVDITNNNSTEQLETFQKPKMSLFNKIKFILTSLFVVLVLWYLATLYYLSTQKLLIDNPTDKGITIQIDDIDSYTSKMIKLWSWKYSLKVNWKNIWDFEKKSGDRNSLLNPTNEIYIAEYILYWDEASFDKLPINKIEAYWNETEWPFKKYEWLYIPWDWDYWINDEASSEVTLSKYSSYTIRSKLYRFNDFVDMYNKVYSLPE